MNETADRNEMKHPEERSMRICIDEARNAAAQGAYALAAFVVVKDKILAVKHTSLQSTFDPTAHAELLAIREAAAQVKSRYLQDGYLYTTCEPCPMCAAAAVFAKMAGIVYGVNQPDAIHHASLRKENSQSWRQIAVRAAYILERGTPKLELYPDVLREECLRLFQDHL
ncbi:MAG: hypothetical protein J2P36_30000 [Ktedonobacteraceae bacterium]|nr:hypothetical protein [Ktedonobacteraceae bacterium]